MGGLVSRFFSLEGDITHTWLQLTGNQAHASKATYNYHPAAWQIDVSDVIILDVNGVINGVDKVDLRTADSLTYMITVWSQQEVSEQTLNNFLTQTLPKMPHLQPSVFPYAYFQLTRNHVSKETVASLMMRPLPNLPYFSCYNLSINK